MFRILVVCTGNICRSPMAEGILRDLVTKDGLGEEVDVRSAGTWAGSGSAASGNAVLAASKLGVEIEQHRSSPLTRSLIEGADLILTMEPAHIEEILIQVPEARDRTHLLTTFADPEKGAATGVDDPIGGTEEEYEYTSKELLGLLELVVPKIRAQHLQRENDPS